MSESQHHHHHEVTEKSVKLLMVSFVINMLLSLVEIIGGIVSGSIALIGDALHNTSDALSILIAVIAFKVGKKKASIKYTYGFKRAEVIGGFVNLILLFISGCYLLIEGILRLIKPEPIEGMMIVVISVLALIVDGVTARISHQEAAHNTNMKMVFVHNLADAFGSVGVIVSGLCVMWFGVYFVDGIIALLIAGYMIFQSVEAFPKVVDILMNAAPDHVDIDEIKKRILEIKDIRDIHHIHLWSVSEHDVALECHVISKNTEAAAHVALILEKEFNIHHSNIQVEKTRCDRCCEL